MFMSDMCRHICKPYTSTDPTPLVFRINKIHPRYMVLCRLSLLIPKLTELEFGIV
jgi:hypothetical protein